MSSHNLLNFYEYNLFQIYSIYDKKYYDIKIPKKYKSIGDYMNQIIRMNKLNLKNPIDSYLLGEANKRFII